MLSRKLIVVLAIVLFSFGCENNTAPTTNNPNNSPNNNPATPAASPSPVNSANFSEIPATFPGEQAKAGQQINTTPSGLKYIDLVEGVGAQAKAGQNVTVNYTGWLNNGMQVDSSIGPGKEPFSFPLGGGRVIPGWDEGVANMKVKGKRKLIIPSNLGYGAHGSPPVVPPNAVLIFDIELLDAK